MAAITANAGDGYRFVEKCTRWYTDYRMTTSARCDFNRLVVFGTEEGVLSISIVTGHEDVVNNDFLTSICGSSVVDVEWMGPGSVGAVCGDENIYLYDVVKDVSSFVAGHQASTKCIRRRDRSTFFSGGRDGYVYGWDMRTGGTCYTLRHGPVDGRHNTFHSIGSIEFNDRREMVMYTSNTPGGTVNMWDLRYLRNGKHIPDICMVSCKSVERMKYCRNNLYAVDTDGSVFKISQSVSCHGTIHQSPGMVLGHGRLHFSEYLDLLLHVCGRALVCVDPDTGTVQTNEADLVGIVPLEFGGFLGYDGRGNICEFAIHGALWPQRN